MVEYMILDVRRAHFYVEQLCEVYVSMPCEDSRSDKGDPTAVLLRSFYGTQDATANWEAEYSAAFFSLHMILTQTCDRR